MPHLVPTDCLVRVSTCLKALTAKTFLLNLSKVEIQNLKSKVSNPHFHFLESSIWKVSQIEALKGDRNSVTWNRLANRFDKQEDRAITK